MNLWKTLKNILSKSSGKAVVEVLIIILAVAVILTILTYSDGFIQFSGYAVNLMRISIGITLFWAFDRFAIPEMNTIEELQKGNVAYGIFLLCFAIIISAAILAG